MKIVVLNNLSDKEFHEVIGGHEVITLSKNYLKKYYNADLFTDCKRVTTALRRFFKALEKDYISFNNYKKEIEESVKKGIYTKSLFEKFDYGFTIGMTHEGYYISITVPMEQEPEQEEEEEQEQEEENTSMKNIKIRTSWSKILRDEENEWSDTDKEYIILDIDMKGVNWNLGCDIMDALEDKINEDGFYSCTKEGCPDFDEEENTFSDCLIFKRDYGSIKEQRRDIIKYVNNIKKEVIKEVLKEQEEQAFETLDKNKKQILKQWKALAESNLNSKELNEQAKEFYSLFKSVLVENKTQLNGNEYKNIISSLRAYGDTKPAKDKDIIVIELLNLNKSSIVLEPGSIEPLNMFLGNVLGWFKKYYEITEEEQEAK